jgi:hypothetical protein
MKHKNLTDSEKLNIFNTEFQKLIEKSKDVQARMIKLEFEIPEYYTVHMDEFLDTFFKDNPFELKAEDMEDIYVQGKIIKKIRMDRRPISYLSIFRFLVLCKTLTDSLKDSINALIPYFKKDIENPKLKDLQIKHSKTFHDIETAGRFYQKFHPAIQKLYIKLVSHINTSIMEAKSNQGEEGFLNLRKINGADFLAANFDPEYKLLLNNLTFLIAIAKEIGIKKAEITSNPLPS